MGKFYPDIAIPKGMLDSAFYNVDAGPRVASVAHSITCRTLLWKEGLVLPSLEYKSQQSWADTLYQVISQSSLVESLHYFGRLHLACASQLPCSVASPREDGDEPVLTTETLSGRGGLL